MSAKAFITDLDGLEPSADERAFLRDERPWGLILFGRNIDTPAQVRELTAGFRDLVGRPDAPVLVDQEGGRVQRFKPPRWRDTPAAGRFGEIFARDPEAALGAARTATRLMAHDLFACGVDVDCLPVLDLPVEGASEVIGDRAYSHDLDATIALARAAVDGLMDGGVLPVMKHMPGHGRADLDTHFGQPTTRAPLDALDARDFAAFRAFADLPMGMTVHMVLEAVDPDHPATQSRKVIESVIRGAIGFDGLLMTDDLSMKALGGEVGPRASACIAAGCDVVLHCNDPLAARIAVGRAVPELAGDALRRADAALAARREPRPLDVAAAEDELAELMGAVA